MLNSDKLHSKNNVRLNGYVSNESNANGNYLPLKSKNKAFLDLLLEYHLQDNSLTEEDILDEALSFFAAVSLKTMIISFSVLNTRVNNVNLNRAHA